MSRWKTIAVDLLPPVATRGLRKMVGKIDDRAPVAEALLWPFSRQAIGSFSQYGEDLVIDGVLGCPSNGVYVDVGANDPIVFSNTKRFSLRGWTGISVEPNPVVFDRLEEDRPLDVNVRAGVGTATGELTFFAMDPDTLSTFDEASVRHNLRAYPGSRIVSTSAVPIASLRSILSQNLEPGTPIDFMSLDVEGREIDALSSNDWQVWRPRLLLVEVNRSGGPIIDYLEGVGYEFGWFNGTNGLFADVGGSDLV